MNIRVRRPLAAGHVMMAGMVETRRSPLQFGLRFIFLLLLGVAVLASLLPVLGAGPLLFLLGLIVAIAALVAIGRSILGPLDRAARNRMRPTQFTMVDFLSLMFLFQLPMAALHAFFDVREEPRVWVFDVFGWIACSLMWGASVSTLSRAGIEKTWQRGVFLAFVLPITYFGAILFTMTLFASGIGLFVERRVPPRVAALVAGIIVGLAIAFYLAARFVRKMVAESDHSREPDPEIGNSASTDPA